MWRWLNEPRLTWALDQCPDEQLDDVLDALDLLLEDPWRADLTAVMQSTRDHVDRMIALLPHGWVLVYSIHPDGVPPGPRQPGLVVRSLDHRFPSPDA